MKNQLFQQVQKQQQMKDTQADPQFNNYAKNPFGFLASHNLNIPQEYQKSPRSAVEYLVNSGQISQSVYDNAMRKLQSMGIKLA